jgi:glycosyltransferase involved in cell wall biosynthesis
MKKIRIAHILTSIEFGGIERVCFNHLENNDRNIFEIELILLVRPWEKESTFHLKIKNIVEYIHTVPVALYPRSVGIDICRIFRCIHKIHSILKKGNFDIVHAHGYFADFAGIIAAKLIGIPVVCTCHGYIDVNDDMKLRMYNKLDTFMLKFSDRIIAVSEDIERLLCSCGVRGGKIKLIENSIGIPDIDNRDIVSMRNTYRARIGVGQKDFLIGFVGRVSEEKGLKDLVEAVDILRDGTNPNVKVYIVGTGRQENELKKLVDQKGMKENIVFLGFQEDVEGWILASDVSVLPSLTEGTPMSLLEAMSYAKPVIASNVGGIPKVINNGVNGLLVPPGDWRSLSVTLRNLMNDGGLRKRLGISARETIIAKYDIRSWMERINSVYLALCNKDLAFVADLQSHHRVRSDRH